MKPAAILRLQRISNALTRRQADLATMLVELRVIQTQLEFHYHDGTMPFMPISIPALPRF
jgi:hypothetical protein